MSVPVINLTGLPVEYQMKAMGDSLERARMLVTRGKLSEVVDVRFRIHESLTIFRAACVNAYIMEKCMRDDGLFYLAT